MQRDDHGRQWLAGCRPSINRLVRQQRAHEQQDQQNGQAGEATDDDRRARLCIKGRVIHEQSAVPMPPRCERSHKRECGYPEEKPHR